MSQQSKSSSNTYAILALVLGIVSYLGGTFLTAIPAWILGKAAIKSIDEGDGNLNDRNMAKIGMILGQVMVALCVIGLIIGILIMASMMRMMDDVRDSIEAASGVPPQVETSQQIPAALEEGILEQGAKLD